jgi:quinol monooxygenase YgiN
MHPFRPATYLPSAAAALVVSAVFASGAPAQEKPNPLVAQVKAAVKDPTQPFTLLVRFQAKEGAGPRVEAAFAKAVRLTRREKGCLAYDFCRDARLPTRFLVYERWQNLAALEAHQNSAHIAALRKEIGDLRTAPPEAEVLLPAGE